MSIKFIYLLVFGSRTGDHILIKITVPVQNLTLKTNAFS